MADIVELFNKLESNQGVVVEEVKKTIHEIFNSTKESFMVNGLFDYFVNTSSIRSVEILVGVREPHDKYLFDRIAESLKSSSKLQALTLLGHVVRRHPLWIYKITNHSLMKDLLRLLKIETDILSLMSALLIIIVLLPMIPGLIGSYLQDIFEVFRRLAAWNANNPNKVPEEHLLHLQVGLYLLFHRLYGMYPCNFLSFLRNHYGQRENLQIFSHTIKPMLDTVKMHPLLVTASKDAETASTRWKNMEDHDVIVECAKYALEGQEKCWEDSKHQGLIAPSVRSRSGFELSDTALLKNTSQLSTLNAIQAQGDTEVWSPSMYFGLSTPPPQESAPTSIPQTPNSQFQSAANSSVTKSENSSPPEAAIEATPETTPIKDIRNLIGRAPPTNSSVVRALNSFGGSKWQGLTSNHSTPVQSQPSSPMRKEYSPFYFPSDTPSAFENIRDSLSSTYEHRDPIIAQKLLRIQQERMQVASEHVAAEVKGGSKAANNPLSPLKIFPVDNNLMINLSSIENTATKALPEKNGFRFDIDVTHGEGSQEDQEVLEIVRQGEQLTIDTQPRVIDRELCDSVLQEIHPPHVDEYDECQPPCTTGGLHMPSSRSMLDLIRRSLQHQHRQRFYSQCAPESTPISEFSTGSSPSESFFPPMQDRVRRANSCPEMKKGSSVMEMNKVSVTLDEKEEIIEEQVKMMNGSFKNEENVPVEEQEQNSLKMVSISTQTTDLWTPTPYEHLFCGILPPLESHEEYKTESAPCPVSTLQSVSLPYGLMDKCVENLVHSPDSKKPKSGIENEVKLLKEQLVLFNTQLHFERHRREVHAERNRRLLGKSRTNRALEEHNLALRDQLSLLQKDKENLRSELERYKVEANSNEMQLQDTINYWQSKFNCAQKDMKSLKNEKLLMEQELKQVQEEKTAILKDCEKAEAELFKVQQDMNQAMEQANVGAVLKSNMEQLQCELMLMGELQQYYRDCMARALPVAPSQESLQAYQAYSSEIENLHEIVEVRGSSLEAARARVLDLESQITRKDMLIAEQKRILKQVKDEYSSKLEAVESKYRTQRAINQKLEENILQLHDRIGHLADKLLPKGKPGLSPEGGASSSVQEVQSNFSPHNSPLSQSLSSPEGQSLSSMMASEAVEMKNLQVIVDRPEQPAEMVPEDTLDSEEG